jgi:hypothetical protein
LKTLNLELLNPFDELRAGPELPVQVERRERNVAIDVKKDSPQRHRVRRDRRIFLIKTSLLGVLSGHEKKFQNDENVKISLNEIEYLQVLIFAKTNFFSCPASQRCKLRAYSTEMPEDSDNICRIAWALGVHAFELLED